MGSGATGFLSAMPVPRKPAGRLESPIFRSSIYLIFKLYATELESTGIQFSYLPGFLSRLGGIPDFSLWEMTHEARGGSTENRTRKQSGDPHGGPPLE
jgi:hypothetical protein